MLNVPIPFFLFMQSPVVKTETISFSSVPAGGETLEISTKEVPVVHTETKTITYESSQVRNSAKYMVSFNVHLRNPFLQASLSACFSVNFTFRY